MTPVLSGSVKSSFFSTKLNFALNALYDNLSGVCCQHSRVFCEYILDLTKYSYSMAGP